VANDAIFVHDKRGALRPLVLIILDVVVFQDAVLLQDLAVHVAEKREGHADFFREGAVGGGAVYADSENYGVCRVQLGLISLIGLEFFRSTFGERQHIEGEDHVFLPAIIRQMHGVPFVVEQCKVGCGIPDLERRVSDFFLFLRADQRTSRCQADQRACGNKI